MIKRLVVPSVLATALVTALVGGCGSSTSGPPGNGPGDGGNNTTPDTGTTGNPDGTTTGNDGGTTPEAGTNPGLPDGSVYPHGNLLVPSSSLAIDGVTTDDFVVYTDKSASTVSAISLAAGSKPIALGAVDANNDVAVIGKSVFIAKTATNNVGTVLVWNSALAAPAVLSTTIYVGFYQVSPDGNHVAFVDGLSGANANISLAKTDGTGKVTLVTHPNITEAVCNPNVGWAGVNTVIGYCATAVDAGAPDGGTNGYVETVALFAPGSTTPVTIATDVLASFTSDETGSVVVVVGKTGSMAYPITGSTVGAPVAIDANAALGTATNSPGIVTKDGSHMIYPTTSQALSRAATTAPAGVTQLVPGPAFSDVYALSADEKWAVGTLAQNSTNGTTDLFFASATTAGTATALSAATTGNVIGDIFTTDSSHVFFLTGFASATGGTLNTAAVTAPGTPTVLGTNAIADLATSGGKVVFNANYDRTSSSADLFAADTTTTAAPTVLVTAADTSFATNNAKTMIVYTWSYEPTSGSAGLWSVAAP